MKDKNAASDLAKMVGTGDTVSIAGKSYRIIPLKLKEIPLFFDDNIILNEQQIYNIATPDAQEKTDKWLTAKVTCANGEPFSYQRAMDDDWDLDDLKDCLRHLARLSG
jgi:hypothetical protein